MSCAYCGKPVHPHSWFSVYRRHCLLRTFGYDCTVKP